jgi:rod shape-determining protein MreD
MNRINRRGTWVIVLSILVALLLTILPLPMWARWLRPLWSLLVVSYWAIALEDKVSVGIAFVVGVLLDILGGSLFGEHALLMVLCVFVMIKLRRQIRFFPMWQQSVLIFILALFYQLGVFIIQSLVQEQPSSLLFWLPSITTAILWPWIFIILRDVRRRFNVQ